MNPESASAAPPPARAGWLNRNVLGAGLTSFLADASYETATAVLPGFLSAIGAPAVSLGAIEGSADAVASFVKLGSAWWSDRVGHRKGIVTLGYVLGGCTSALFVLAVVVGWPIVLVGRVLGWLGKGIRGPLRDAILAESVDPADRGKVFGFHRAGDTLGALAGPVVAGAVLFFYPPTSPTDTWPQCLVFLATLVPGIGSAVAFVVLIREQKRAPNPRAKLWASIKALPKGYRRLLVALGVFGAGDFSHTLLIFAAVEVLRPVWGDYTASLGVFLYALRNASYTVASFPVGLLGDRFGRGRMLVVGYFLGVAVMLLFATSFAFGITSLAVLAVLTFLAGVFIAFEDALEGALTADYVEEPALRNTAYGVMGTVNGVGDFISSVVVSLLWTLVPGIGFAAGFGYAAVLMFAGALLLVVNRGRAASATPQ